MEEKKRYNPQEIEPKWQKYWEENETYKCEVDTSKKKYYVLDMFPYPSGAGLHVGHVVGYTGSDVVARYKRQKGFNVLHPMGWDSFGLPAEQYAIRTGTHPQITTERNIETYQRQLKALGLSYDWSRELATSDSKYYKWTQWIFTKLFEKGLAYEADMMVNFCPALGTVLANEEIEEGKSVEGGYPVERRPLRQWVLKITEYADRLLEDLDTLDWPEHLKKLQRNWIGKSEGIDINFNIEESDKEIVCFTTRPDTLFGVTFIVVAPEYPDLMKMVSAKCRKQVENYKKVVQRKSDLERTDLAKTKSGVFTGAYAINPLTKEKVPIWIADYVLMSYGSGAVMGVPADDMRDREFAEMYEIPIIEIFNEEGAFINSTNNYVDLTGLTIDEAKKKISGFLIQIGKGKKSINYKLRDWIFSRQRYWGEPFPILHFDDGTKRVLERDELPLTPPLIEDYKPSLDGQSPLAKARNWVDIFDERTGKKAHRETNTMPQWAGSCWYYLRFIDPLNDDEAWSKDKEEYWMPVDLYVGGVEHAVLHLLYARFWHKVLYDLGYASTKEPFQCLRNQGLVTARSYKLETGGYVSQDEVEMSEGNYYQKTTHRRVIPLIEKMSKSKLNGVSPDEMIQEYGADALRLYELFLTPFDKEKLWQTDAVSGCKRFLTRVYDLVVSDKVQDILNEEAQRLIAKVIKGVEEDLETLSFNTAIAKMMEFLNRFSELDVYPRAILKQFIQLIYPFAPHFGEECWALLGEKSTISYAPFPKYEERYLEEEDVTIVFQVSGKVRGQAQFKKGVTQKEVENKAKEEENVQRFLIGPIKKAIFVPDKLINFVV